MCVRITKKESMKAPNTVERGMDMELFTIVKAESMLENGYKIRCRGKVLCFILLRNWLTRVNGKMTNLRDMVFYIMRM